MKNHHNTFIGIFGLIIISLVVWSLIFALQENPTPILPTLAKAMDSVANPDATPIAIARLNPVSPLEQLIGTKADKQVHPQVAKLPLDHQLDSMVQNQASTETSVVPDQYIVQFAENTSATDRMNYLNSIGAIVIDELPELNQLVIVSEQAPAQSASDIVLQVEPDYIASALLTVTPQDTYYGLQWNLEMVNAQTGWQALPDDAPTITVAVIDSGVCLNLPDMQGRYTSYQRDFVDGDLIPEDVYGHGCSVAGLIASNINNIGIAGIAPHVQIMPLRVLGDNGNGTYSNITNAIVTATNQGAQIINLSLGGAANSSTLNSAINYAINKGVLVVASTGNSGGAQPLYPAAYEGVIAVGSVNSAGHVSSFSNGGADLLAPGEAIIVPYLNHVYVYQSGTSFSAPHVSAVAAIELALGRSLVIDGGIVRVQDIIPPTPTPSKGNRNPDENIDPASITTPIITDTWVVILASDINADALAQSIGFVNLGQISNLENYYLFQLSGSNLSEATALSASNILSNTPGIMAFEQELAISYQEKAIPTDPLVSSQWHLINTGQSGGTSGEDVNITGAWDSGIDGTGVTIAIVDDGLQHSHADFSAKYLPSASHDFNGNDSDPAPVNTFDDHGTSAAGVAAADNDGITCGVGVAYNANLAGLRLIAAPVTDSTQASALNYAMNINDIYSNSWGPPDDGDIWAGPGISTRAALQNGVENGRDGKGNIYVWAAGNGGWLDDDHSNADGYANSRYTIAVGATDNDGNLAFYSEGGSNILVNAPSSDETVGITTTDLIGSAGSSSGNCTNTFGGTSAAAPAVAGVVALMLDANPNLSWRDVQHILVETAEKNDPSDIAWQPNAAGYDTHYYYGFGRVDANAAVQLAKIWTGVPPEVSDLTPTKTVVNGTIPDALAGQSSYPFYSNPRQSSIEYIHDITLETVEVNVNVSHTYMGDLAFVLQSPDGTQSVLALSRFNDSSNGTLTWTFTSNEFWGESAKGNWTLYVYDGFVSDTGTFNNWSLKFFGSKGVYKVNTTNDSSDGNCDSVHCSIREAIRAANGYGDGAIVKIPAGTYNLNIAGTGENSAQTGDLDITKNIHIVGAGSDLTIIDANDIDRVFDVYSPATIEGLTIRDGQPETSAHGGGIRVNDTNQAYYDVLQLIDVVFNSNTTTSGNGGGLAVLGDIPVWLTDSEFSANSAANGGAIYGNLGDIAISFTDIHNNTASNFGGGTYNINDSNLDLFQSLIRANQALSGGGAYLDESTYDIRNSTISGNSARLDGGGIYADTTPFYGGITFSTLSQNKADSDNNNSGNGGGVFVSDFSELSINNSIIYGNQDLGGQSNECQAPNAYITATGSNFIGNTSNCNVEIFDYNFLIEQDYTGINPQLLALANNGGETLTHALSPSSPAIDSQSIIYCAVTSVIDQRGALRDSIETCDSGAYEYISGLTLPIKPIVAAISYDNFGPNSIISGGSGITYVNHYINEEGSYDGADTLELLFNQRLYNPTGNIAVNDVTNLDNYMLIRNGANAVFNTSTCGIVQGDDIAVSINSVDYSAFKPMTLLNLNGTADLPFDKYRLIVCNLLNADGTALDGNADEVVGDDFVYEFLVEDTIQISVYVDNDVSVSAAIPFRFELDFAVNVFKTTFSRDMQNIGGGSDINAVANPANYRLMNYGADGTFQTNSCSLQGDDQQISIDSVTYDNSGEFIAMISPTSPLTSGVYRFILCDTLRDTSGERIDGDQDGTPGGDAITEFLILLELTAPDGLNAVASSQVDLTWNDNSADESEFRIERRESGGDWEELATVAANETSYSDTAIVCNVNYDYRVRAYREFDDNFSEYSNIAFATVTICPPDAPSGLVINAIIAQEQLNLTWTDNSVDESEFRIQRSLNGSTGWTAISTVAADTSVFNDSDVNLDCYTAYFYRVYAFRAGDSALSAFSNVASAFTSCITLAPPSNLEAVSDSDAMQITWDDNSLDESNFELERAIANSGAWSIIATLDPDTELHTDSTTSCGTSYDYRIRAYRAEDTQYSSYSTSVQQEQTCTPPIAPSNVIVSNNLFNNDLTITWQDNSLTETDFYIERSAHNLNSWSQIGTVNENVTVFIDTDAALTCYTIYDYRIRAHRDDDNVDSGYSSVASNSTGCDPEAIGALTTFADTADTINATAFPTLPKPTCSNASIHRYTWTYTPDANRLINLNTFSSNFDTILSVWTNTGSLAQVACNDNGSAGTSSALTLNVNTGTTYYILVGGKNGASGSIAFNLSEIEPPTSTPLPSSTPIPTNTPEPNMSIVGLYRNNLWLFRDDNTSGFASIGINFGTTEAGWMPLVGDWDGDGIDGIGLYKDGLWLLREVAESNGTIDYAFAFGKIESGWQAIVGDWDGDGTDGIGLYKDGLWILRNSISSTSNDFMFQFNPSGATAKAIAGDWFNEAKDRIGLYRNGIWYLKSDLSNSSQGKTFAFGPTDGTWQAITGDWNEDGLDTIGVYRDGIWRLRNSNDAGAPHLGFNFALDNAMPVAGYRGDAEGLKILSVESAPPATMTAIPTNTISFIETATPTATMLSIGDTLTPTVTTSPTATASHTPSPTIEPAILPENISGT